MFKSLSVMSLVLSFLMTATGALAAGLEPVSGVEIQQSIYNNSPDGKPHAGPAQVTFKAWSGGCSRSSDFALKVTKTAGKQTLTIVRLQQDMCEAVAHLQQFTISTSDLDSNAPTNLANPIATEIRWME
jgi:hypothetical protein